MGCARKVPGKCQESRVTAHFRKRSIPNSIFSKRYDIAFDGAREYSKLARDIVNRGFEGAYELESFEW